LIAIATLALSASIASARAQWTSVANPGASDTAPLVYYWSASLRLDTAGILSTWMKEAFNGGRGSIMVSLREFYCASHLRRESVMDWYLPDKSFYQTIDLKPEDRRWVPFTNFADSGASQTLCERARGLARKGDIALDWRGQPSRWGRVAINPKGDTLSYDRETYRREGDLVVTWMLVAYGVPQKVASGGVATSAKQRWEIRCAAQQYRLVSVVSFAQDGQAIPGSSGSGETAWNDVVPETVGEDIVSYLCSTPLKPREGVGPPP
jgi:hypothetical protein